MKKVIIIVTLMGFFASGLIAVAKDASWDSPKDTVKTQEVRKKQGNTGKSQAPGCPKCQNGDRSRTAW